MITIYGNKRSSAFRCVWLLEELHIPYEIKEINMKAGENKSAEYLRLNPNGKIPTMVDGDFVLWESLAINYYLIEKYNGLTLVGSTVQEHALVNQWNLWSLIHLYAAFHPLTMQQWRGTPESEATKQAREIDVPRYLAVLEGHLKNKKYMTLERFTLADITAMSVMRGADAIKYDLTSYPNIVAWMERLTLRPAYEALVQAP